MTETLDDLAAQADTINTAPTGAAAVSGPAPDAPEAAPPAPGNFEAIAFMLAAGREVVCMALEVSSLRTTLADDKVEQVARVLAPVADKYGLQLGGFVGGPEATALFVAGPILFGAYKALMAELKAKAADAPKAAVPAPAADDGRPLESAYE